MVILLARDQDTPCLHNVITKITLAPALFMLALVHIRVPASEGARLMKTGMRKLGIFEVDFESLRNLMRINIAQIISIEFLSYIQIEDPYLDMFLVSIIVPLSSELLSPSTHHIKFNPRQDAQRMETSGGLVYNKTDKVFQEF